MNKNQLIEDNMNLVHFLIYKHYPTYSKNEDIIQQGMLGLCIAAESYDECKGKFSTYASYCVLNSIRKWFRANKKHNSNLSLDYEIPYGETETKSLVDTIIGEVDVDMSNVVLTQFRAILTPKEQEFLDLLQNNTLQEVVLLTGLSKQTVSSRMRSIKRKWRKFNENQS